LDYSRFGVLLANDIVDENSGWPIQGFIVN
jgi:hypothetical protein